MIDVAQLRAKFADPRTARLFIVMVVILLSTVLAYKFQIQYFELVLLMVVGLGTVIVFLRWPASGLLVLVFSSMLVPFAIGTGTNTEINITILLLTLLLALWLLDMVARQRQIYLIDSPVIFSVMVFVLVSILSFGMGQFDWYPFAQNASLSAQIGGLSVFILSAGAFLLGAHQIPHMRWLKRLCWLYIIIGSFVVAGGLIPPLENLILGLFPRGSTRSLFWTWFAALAFSQAFINRGLSSYTRAILVGLVLGSLYINLFLGTSWTSGWLPALMAIITIVWVGIPRLRLYFALLGGVIAVLYFTTIWDFVVSINQYSLLTRLEAWRIVSEIVKANPVFGLGPSNYRFYTPLFSILGYNVAFNSHNNYVDIIAQTGLAGLACFIWFCWEIGRLGWRLYPRVSDGFAKAYVLGCLGGLAGTLVAGMLADWVLPFVYNIGLNGMRSSVLAWLFLGGLLAVEKVAQRPQV